MRSPRDDAAPASLLRCHAEEDRSPGFAASRVAPAAVHRRARLATGHSLGTRGGRQVGAEEVICAVEFHLLQMCPSDTVALM